jgi:hypothetical protein
MTRSIASRSDHASLVLWYSVLAAPVAWSLHLLVCYLLVSTACDADETRVRLLVARITALTEATIVTGGIAGYRYWRRGDDGPVIDNESRPTFMAYLGLTESVLFFIGTLFTAAPAFALPVCT